jgi:hypothetical protein
MCRGFGDNKFTGAVPQFLRSRMAAPGALDSNAYYAQRMIESQSCDAPFARKYASLSAWTFGACAGPPVRRAAVAVWALTQYKQARRVLKDVWWMCRRQSSTCLRRRHR